MLRKILIILITYSSIAFSQSTLNIKGYFKGLGADSYALLLKYDIENSIFAKSKLYEGICFFENITIQQEGIYQIMVINQDAHESKSYAFDIIVDKSENVISFEFEPKINPYPNILESNINKNWYEYLEIEKFRFGVIDYIKSNIKNQHNISKSESISNEKMLKNEIEELITLKEKYIKKENNKWIIASVKNNPFYLDLINTDKKTFWKALVTDKPDLINSSIYPIIIRYYIQKFYSTADEEQFIKCFDEVINNFSNNSETEKWTIMYVAKGIEELNSRKLRNYFKEKYSYYRTTDNTRSLNNNN